MAKGVVSARREINHGIHEEFPLKVIYSDTEPARNYIWGHPNGNYYVWTDCKWVLMELPKKEGQNCCCNCNCDCVTKDGLEIRLANFKKDVLSAFIRLSENKCDDSSAVEDWIQDEIERLDREITNLKNSNTSINTVINNVNNAIANLNQVDTDTDSRLDVLEAHDSSDCVTAEDTPDN